MKFYAILVSMVLYVLPQAIIPAPLLADSREKVILSVVSHKTQEDLTKKVYDTFNKLTNRFVFELLPMPAARAATFYGRGHVDGAALRGKHFTDSKFSKNLIRVPTALIKATARLVVRDGMTEIKGWGEELKGRKVALRRDSPGYFDLIPESSQVEVATEVQGLKMLQQGRVDAFAVLDAIYFDTVYYNPDLGRNLRLVKAEMPELLYMFIHKDRQELIPALDIEIQKAVATGDLQKSWDEGVQKVRKNAEVAVAERTAHASLQ